MAKGDRIGKGFDRVSSIYDWTVRTVFGFKIHEFQYDCLKAIEPSDHTLIVGGGTGTILLQCLDLSIAQRYTYCELSEKMLARTQSKLDEALIEKVRFKKEIDHSDGPFDLIILPFVLDCYNPSSMLSLLETIEANSTPKTTFLILDFSEDFESGFIAKHLRHFLIWMLYQFFSILGATNTKSLPDIKGILLERGYEMIKKNSIYEGWIFGSQWKYAAPIIAVE